MSRQYILRNGEPVPEPDLLAWGRWFETADRSIAMTRVERAAGAVEVSTVFLGIDHNFRGTGLPILFETIVFQVGTDADYDCRRYATLAEAMAGHAAMVEEYHKPERGVT